MTASQMNKYFVELIIYNIPNTLLMGDEIGKIFYKCLNFLQNCSISKFTSFDGKPLDSFTLAEISYANIKTFLHYISKII